MDETWTNNVRQQTDRQTEELKLHLKTLFVMFNLNKVKVVHVKCGRCFCIHFLR